ncbi:hypothetical protein [Teredinibacter sp. KSP-S5-2]|uniref:hypothetical protein n=1 Tax=Teredinibacter sp. KSP-S5-2 TaxID=3034506 RepID=UPI002934E08B|nr:hypothetical protein [Teredinibacter sp. KSP-S5-2]WNO10586.1 hypothetical protein P5V12_05305 [Teredinibacter sp. KSP-S5-2]
MGKNKILDKYLIPILMPIITAAIGIYGVHMGLSASEKALDRAAKFQVSHNLLEIRRSLFERVSIIYAKRDLAETLEKEMEFGFNNSSEILSRLKKGADKGDVAFKQVKRSRDAVQGVLDSKKELIILNSEYHSVVSMISISFGPETNKIVSKINSSKDVWWQVNSNEFDSLMQSMLDEMYYGL